VIRALTPEDAEVCDAIVASLPGWFGDPGGLAECARAVRSQRGLVALAPDDRVVGFLTWLEHADAAEITWMAVDAASRRSGIGRALLDGLVATLRVEGPPVLTVMTLSARDPDPGYAETRAFYLANGFVTVKEFDLWGPENPAVLLVRALRATG
jgi:ribosomal protein S18 acetylase RimI-like enzyme